MNDVADENAREAPVGSTRLAAARSYIALVRPRIMALVLVAMAVAALAAGPQPIAPAALAHALFGTALVIAGAVALNQRYEYRADAVMPRTAARPLPAGRMSRSGAMAFGLATTVAGLAYLVWATTATLTALAGLSWLLYVAAYTPLKAQTPWQTPVGAVAGAMPVLLGAAAADALTSSVAWGLFGVLFCWQLPHAMAIAWLFRDEFAAARVKVAPVVDPSGRSAAALARGGAAALIPLGAWSASSGGWLWSGGAALAGAAFTIVALAFGRDRSAARARWLLRASLIYLPVVLGLILAARWL